MARPIAVIDIGSNSIKVLVVSPQPDGTRSTLFWKTIDTRISAGISRTEPRLSEIGMSSGVAAVVQLIAALENFQPCDIVVVATSAVRDAENGSDFAAQILSATGQSVRILKGEEEANYIGRGLTCDPALTDLRDFYIFDLGGGSLECLSFLDRKIVQAKSLPLGCVRLTESCVSEATQEFQETDFRRIIDTTRAALRESAFTFSLPPHAIAVGTGGTLTTARAVLAARRGRSLETSDSRITLAELRELLNYVGRSDLADRKRIPALPPARADVFPAALATVIAVAEIGGLDSYWNSNYNLRWGIVDEHLSGGAREPAGSVDH
jgi:exopolyphosphatase / guanosine-5'-triphosphate,3'-diphosphate pyrophosphatase